MLALLTGQPPPMAVKIIEKAGDARCDMSCCKPDCPMDPSQYVYLPVRMPIASMDGRCQTIDGLQPFTLFRHVHLPAITMSPTISTRMRFRNTST